MIAGHPNQFGKATAKLLEGQFLMIQPFPDISGDNQPIVAMIGYIKQRCAIHWMREVKITDREQLHRLQAGMPKSNRKDRFARSVVCTVWRGWVRNNAVKAHAASGLYFPASHSSIKPLNHSCKVSE